MTSRDREGRPRHRPSDFQSAGDPTWLETGPADPTAGRGAGADGVDLEIGPGLHLAPYQLIREIGHGGMGVVYAARDTQLGRRVAIKFLRKVDDEVIDRFLVEARATAHCTHDNIVVIHGVGQYFGMPYLVFEYLEGRTLRDVLEEFAGEPMPPARVVELMTPVARALVRAHELGIVHRDLKPENIMVTDAGQVKVLDFGIAKALGGEPSARPDPTDARRPGLTLTDDGAIIGTLPYMAPEQMGGSPIDHRADLFAVGVILFELLTGRHPVEPFEPEALFRNLVTPTPLPSVGGVVDGLPPALVAVVDECLRKGVADRLGGAAELARRLEQLTPTARPAHGDAPFLGLAAFQEHDAGRFFGRGRDVARLVARVREQPLTAVVGPSGVGKSSLVRAGVGPTLKAADPRWEIITLRPGRHPLAALASVLERVAPHALPVDASADPHAALTRRLLTEPGCFGVALRTRAQVDGRITLVFVDQLEELYTLVPASDERRAFTTALAAVADDVAAPLRVVVSIRGDFLDRVGEDPGFFDGIAHGLVFLAAPDRAGLREALLEPVAAAGYRFEQAAIVDDMVDVMAETPGALPLLQFTAARLWEARDRDRHQLTAASYQALGGVRGALAAHAEEVVGALDGRGQRLAREVCRRLVTPERTRAVVELADLDALDEQPARVRAVIDQLVAARLVVVHARGEAGGSVELIHESLIGQWPSLRRWLDEERDDVVFLTQLAAAARQWEARGRPTGLLWRGDAAAEARRWAATRAWVVPPRDQPFLDAVLALARRSRRVRVAAVAATMAVLAAAAGGATVAYLRVRAAEQTARASADRADRENAAKTEALAAARAQQQVAERAVADRTDAQRERTKAEAAAADTSALLGMSREQLERKNAELEASTREAQAAEARATAASVRAVAAADEARRAKAELQVRLEAEQQRVRALQDEARKLTTKLKD
ncbi:MAG: serine/threonine-protein kinase [Kofleriaceae bacterium]